MTPRPIRWSQRLPRRRVAKRVALAILVVALLLGLYNDFAIRWRVADSLAGALPRGTALSADRCQRMTSLALQGKNFFACPVRQGQDGRADIVYHLEVKGRCWTAIPFTAPPRVPRTPPPALRGCLSPFAVGAIGR